MILNFDTKRVLNAGLIFVKNAVNSICKTTTFQENTNIKINDFSKMTAISQHMAVDPFCKAVSKYLDTQEIDPGAQLFKTHSSIFKFFSQQRGLLKILLLDKELLILPLIKGKQLLTVLMVLYSQDMGVLIRWLHD